jgi:hypothetical protein
MRVLNNGLLVNFLLRRRAVLPHPPYSPDLAPLRLPPLWCHPWEKVCEWWRGCWRREEVAASTKFTLVQEGDRWSWFSLAQGCWSWWRLCRKWGVSCIHLVTLWACSNNHMINYLQQKLCCKTFRATYLYFICKSHTFQKPGTNSQRMP